MRQDLAFAVRTLRHQPAFTIAAIATLAMGIGATTAIFSTVNAALLRPLPYPRPDDLRLLGTAMTDGRVTTGKVAGVELAPLNNSALSIVKVAPATAPATATLLGKDGSPGPVEIAAVGEGFFDVLGLPMAAGRPFTHAEHVAITGAGPPPVAIVSYRLWRDRFGRDPDLVGQPIRLLEFNDPLTIVGVAAKDVETPPGVDLWFNLRMDLGNQGHNVDVYLRVRPGTTTARLRSELAGVMGGLAREYPVADRSRVYTVRTLVEALVGDLGPMLVLVLGASALLLLLACVNVTNLLLARGAVRAREIALRVALGASRGRIVRQLLTESLVLATGGAVAGVALAWVGVRLLRVLGVGQLPRLDAVPFDSHVLLFALAALVATALLVGFAPAFRLAGTDIKSLMSDGGRSATSGRAQHRLLATMVVLEIALAIMLVAGAGWLVQSFLRQQHADPGFVARGRLAVNVLVPFAKYGSPGRVAAWSHEVSDRLHGIGGVTEVASTATFPLLPGSNTGGVTYLAFQEQLDDPDHPRPAHPISISPGFFPAMGIRLTGGRAFTPDDRADTARVTIVNRSFVRHYLEGRDPLTERFAIGYPTIDAQSMLTIVGVVDDVKYGSLAEAPEPIFYVPQDQAPYWTQTIVVATSLANPAAIAPMVRAAMKSVDPQLFIQIAAVPDLVSLSLSRQRLGVLLMTVFAGAALALAAIGIYGVIAYASAQRLGEVATRMALGATPRQVFWLMMSQGRTMSALGTMIGIAGAFSAGRIVASQLSDVRTGDPLILAAAVAMVLALAGLAIVVPARRASRVDPARVLRLG